MNLYHCMIELRSDAKALSFAYAAAGWLDGLKDRQMIGDWRLWRRKFGLGSNAHADFMLEIEVNSLQQLDETFQTLTDSETEDAYDSLHHMIERVETGLYRPFPDAQQRERVALI